MRTNKFRGIIKNPDELFDEWVYGDLIHYANGTIAIRQQETGQEFEVDPETVGQFTGVFDKNGKEIYEWDILFGREEGDCETTAWTNFYYKVFYDEKLCSFMAKYKDDTYWDIIICELNEQYEIIGNIFDKPELLKN